MKQRTCSFLSKKKWCVIRKLLFSCIRILVLMEFYHLKTHLMGSTRPMLAAWIEYAEQKVVITRLLTRQCVLPPWPLQYCCDNGRRNEVSSRFLTQPCPFPLCMDLEPAAKVHGPRHFKEHMQFSFYKNYLELLSHIVKYISFYNTMPMTWHGPNYSPCPGPRLEYQQNYLLLCKPYSGVSHLEFCLQDKAHNPSALLICIKLLVLLLHNEETWYQSI